MLKDDVFYLECNFSTLLPFVNSQTEKNRVLNFNKNIKSNFYPLTKTFLQNHYLNTNYSNLKNTFRDVNCAADCYSYFVQSYGMVNGGASVSTGGASGANSSGLNPFSPYKLDLGFNLGSLSWLWFLVAGVIIYKVTK